MNYDIISKGDDAMKKLFRNIINTKTGILALILIIINSALTIYTYTKAKTYIPDLITTFTMIFAAILVLLLILSSRLKKTSIFFNIFLSVILIFTSFTFSKTREFTETITDTKEYEDVEIIVKADNKIAPDSDLTNLVLGAFLDDDLGLKRAREILDIINQKKVRERLYDSMSDAYNDLLNGNIDMLVLSAFSSTYLEEYIADYSETTKVLFSKSYELTNDMLTKEIDILNESFTVYLCGTDASGKSINKSSRSDSNMLLTINPKTKQISLQIIPRDLYTYVESKNASTKLSWSGSYGGVTTSMKGLEHELGIDIDYWAKINWQGIVDLVDALGGIEAYSHYNYELNGFHYQKGINHINGKQALLMCTERKSLPNNELSRGLQQMEVLKGIIKKLTEIKSIDSIYALLNSIEDNFITNFPEEKFFDAFTIMINMRDKLGDIDSYTMKGYYDWKYDAIKKNYYVYYFYPNKGEIEKIRDRINDVILGR